MSAPTLTEALAARGLTHVPRDHPGWQGRKVLNAKKETVFEGSAGQCWRWLREGAVPGHRPNRESW